MDYIGAVAAATGFIKHWHLDGALLSKLGDESWQVLSFVDYLLKNPSEVVTKASEDRQTFRQVQQAAAQIFRLMHLAETEELENWEREGFSEIHVPKELYPWLAEFLADPKAATPNKKSDTAKDKQTVARNGHTFSHNNNRDYIIACAVKKLARNMSIAGGSMDREGSASDAVAEALKDLGLGPGTAGAVLDVYYKIKNIENFSDAFPDEPWFPEK